MFWFWGKKRGIEKLENEVRTSFSSVKEDFGKVSKWIQHIDVKNKNHESELSEIKDHISLIKSDLQEIKDFISFFGPKFSKQALKQAQTTSSKHTVAVDVQTPVQTAVQSGILSNLTVMERAIMWALINAGEMKMSYEDLAALMGKDKSTIRGQINAIKQKSEGLIEEQIELNGKKRLFVPEKVRNFIVKSVKVRVKTKEKVQKSEEKQEEKH